MKKQSYEKALLVGCQLSHVTDEHFESSLSELESLTETAGGRVVSIITQKRERQHPATYIGKGKVQELMVLVSEAEPDIVIFNDELSPSQLRNLSSVMEDVRLIDRTQLILDIFAQRAQSREGQLQVELAQLKYAIPRLVGQGAALSRQGGGIGTKGPGETKLESDKRHIRNRITEITRQLDQVVKHRERYRERRKRNSRFTFALAGYTNAGKSTIFNNLTRAGVFEEDLLFATLDPTTRECTLPSGFKVLISDTVGFIQDLPTSLIAAFRSTLEEVSSADEILHVVDGSNTDFHLHEAAVAEVLDELDASNIPQMTVYNKRDLMTNVSLMPVSGMEMIQISARDEADINKLLQSMEKMVKAQMDQYIARIDVADGKSIARLKDETILESLTFVEEDNGYVVKGYALKDHPVNKIVNGV